jgi:vacuolar-type H+-ATPase subunit H
MGQVSRIDYSAEERRKIIEEARETARLLLEKLELLARLDERGEGAADGGRADTG